MQSQCSPMQSDSVNRVTPFYFFIFTNGFQNAVLVPIPPKPPMAGGLFSVSVETVLIQATETAKYTIIF